MGLIRAAVGSFNSTMADQWKEYFICDAMNNDTIIQKGYKQQSKRSSNSKGSTDIVSDGSIIAVNNGQAMAIVEDGKIVEFSAEPGVFKVDMKSAPSIFEGGFGKGLINSFKTMGTRFTFGADTGQNIKIYYFNLKELTGLKFGTSQSVPYDDPVYQSINIRYFGQSSLRLEDPIAFYTNISGNVTDKYSISTLWDNQLRSEFIMYLTQAFALLARDGIKYNQIPQEQVKIGQYMNDILDEDWHQKRGLVVDAVGISSVTLDPKDHEKIQKIDEMRLLSNAQNAAGRMTAATANAMESAGENEGGAFMGFAGLNMAHQTGAPIAQGLQNMAATAQQTPVQTESVANVNAWKCQCGTENTGKFCSNCGTAKPVSTEWMCSCGTSNIGKFCSNCGTAKPVSSEWTCSCGTSNTGKFCSNCGSPRK